MKLFLPAILSVLFITGCGPTREWVPCTDSGCESCEGVGNTPCVDCEQKGSLPCEEDTLMNDLLDKKGCKGGIRICMKCGGKGVTVEYVEQNCVYCKGSGRKGYGSTSCTYC
ncbi:MAG: hypothetical protein QF645_12155, partial [Planctomycetota bacterium]|nr:hypothetical protein [Planctomycetota bacterium]